MLVLLLSTAGTSAVSLLSTSMGAKRSAMVGTEMAEVITAGE